MSALMFYVVLTGTQLSTYGRSVLSKYSGFGSSKIFGYGWWRSSAEHGIETFFLVVNNLWLRIVMHVEIYRS